MEQMDEAGFTFRDLEIEGIEKHLHFKKNAFSILNHSAPMTYLLDYTTGKYRFISEQVKKLVHFSNGYIIDGGIGFVLDRYHKTDLNLFNNQIFADRLSILKHLPVEEHKDYVFSYSYRFKNGKGNYVNLLQRNSFIKSDKNGNPLLSLGMVINIEHFKGDGPVIHLVEKINPDTGDVDSFIKNTYYRNEEDKIFSRREKEVLYHTSEGLTSKEIAIKFFISEHTVINHKRSMHHKSNTQNAASLVNFAFKNHLL